MVTVGQSLFTFDAPRPATSRPPRPPPAAASTPPTDSRPIVMRARERLLLSRWRRRAQQRILQARAGRVGRAVRVREAWQSWRSWRAWTLGRWHKRVSAELHRWSVLMRLVLRAWRAWQGLHRVAAQRTAAVLVMQANRICERIVRGWRGYVARRALHRHALVHFALALSARCLLHWALWLRSRRQKRPRRLERDRQCALVALRRATGEWLEGAAASRFEARQRWLALDCWAHHAKEAALASWRRARGQSARAIMLNRRAYVFMAASLLARVCGGWRSLCIARAVTDAAVPRVAARLSQVRERQLLCRWAGVVAARLANEEQAAFARSVAGRVAARRAFGRLAALSALARRRAQQAATALAAGRRSLLREPWHGWREAFAARRWQREVRVGLARALRRWHASVRAASAHKVDARAAWSLWRVGLSERVLLAWHAAARREALCRRVVALVALRLRTRQLTAALDGWRGDAARRRRRAAAAPAARRRAIGGVVHSWRAAAVAAEAREVAWRAAVRHRYHATLRKSLCAAWRGEYLVARRAARRVLDEATARRLAATRDLLFARWWGATRRAAEAAAQLQVAAGHADAAMVRRALPCWREAAAAAWEAQRQLGRAKACWRRRLCAKVVGGWLGYACMRSTRRGQKLQRLLALRRTLAGAARGRVFGAWRELHRAKVAQRSLFACRAAALRGRRQRRTLQAMQTHTVRRRVALQALRTAADAAARAAARRTLRVWRTCAATWRHDGDEEQRALVQFGEALRRRTWAAWGRYHLRKQHKAALLRRAAEGHRLRLRQQGVAHWMQVGMARHEAKLDAAAEHAAARAAAALRRVERFARHWRAVAAQRRLTRAGGGSDARRVGRAAPPVPQHGSAWACAQPILWPAPRRVEVADAGRRWDPLAQAAAHLAGIEPTASEAFASEPTASEATWESLLPPPRTRTAPRPLPTWGTSPAGAGRTKPLTEAVATPWELARPSPPQQPPVVQSEPYSVPPPQSPTPPRETGCDGRDGGAAEYGSPSTIEAARRAPLRHGGGERALSAEEAEVQMISEQLHTFASQREAWGAEKRLLERLVTQQQQQHLAGGAKAEWAAMGEAVRAMQARVDGHEAAQAAQQEVVARLLRRISELRSV